MVVRRIRESRAFSDEFYFEQLVRFQSSAFPLSETMLEHYVSKGHLLGLRGHPDADKDALLKRLLSPPARTMHLVANTAASDVKTETNAAVKAIAFYLPQFHPIPENDKWWGSGFTEWFNVTRARPFFSDHNQPRVPADLGYYDLRLSEIRETQAELARSHGVFGFCYYFYWFAGKRLLFRPLDEMLTSGAPDFPFCLCWANENWSRRWDGSESDILIEQTYSPENDIAFCDSLVPYFQDARYIRVDERPLLLVYRPDIIPDLAGTLARWREHFRLTGIGEVYLVGAMTFGFTGGIEAGFDAEVHFPPHSIHLQDRKFEYNPAPHFSGAVFSYDEIVDRHMQFFEEGRTQFFTTMLEWDNTPRRGAAGHVFSDFTVDKYEDWLRASAVKTAELYKPSEQFVFINAWNEWGEGTYLEPDRKHGMSALEATARGVQGLRGGTADFIAESLLKYPPTSVRAAKARLKELQAACTGAISFPAALKSLIAKRRYFRINSVEHKPEPDCICWLESLRVGGVVRTSTFEMSGWIVAKDCKPSYIEISVNNNVLADGKIEAIRADVYDYNGDFTNYRGPNSFLVVLNTPDILGHLRWNSPLTLSSRIYGQDGQLMAAIDLQVAQAIERSALTACSQQFQLQGDSAARGITEAFIKASPVLFVMHDLYPAGSQLFLINFLRWLRTAPDRIEFELLVLLKKSEAPAYGEAAASLQAELEAFVNVFWLDEDTALPTNLNNIEGGFYSILYFNSIATLRYKVALSFLWENAILHVHELDYVTATLLQDDVLKQIVDSNIHIVGCSRAVSETCASWGVAEDRIQTHYSFVQKVEYEGDADARSDIRTELNIAQDASVILMVGSLNWRKGGHLLSCLARDVASVFPSDRTPFFVWVGDEGEAEMRRRIEHEFKLVGLQDQLRLTGQRRDVRTFYKAADVFALTSIEDPFPLVMLEACEERLPVVAFQKSGGADEFIAMGGGGISVPMLDTGAMARALHQILTDNSFRAALCEKAERFSHTLSFDRMAPKLLDFIVSRQQAFAAEILHSEAP